MNGHAYEHYVDQPSSIFKGWNAPLVHEHLTDSVTEAKLAGRGLDATTIARLRWYPSLTSEFILRDLISKQDIDRIFTDFSSRFRALCNHYGDLAPIMEAKLLDDPESVERLVRWLRYKEIDAFHDDSEYFKRLSEDPNRKFRLTPPGERPEREVMSAEAHTKRFSSPGWAFLFVSSNQIAELDVNLMKVLARSEEYSYLTAFVLRRRGLGAHVWQGLLHNIVSLRWAFHAMRDLDVGTRLDQGTQTRLLKIIHSSPPWAVELWESRRWRGDQLSWAYGECVQLADGHECLPELHSWMRMNRAISGPRVAAA